MRSAKKVEVRFEPDDNGMWFVEVVAEPRIHSQGKTIESAERNIREALALWHGGDDDDFDIVPTYALPKRLVSLVELARDLRASAQEIEEELTQKTAQAVEQLSDRGISRRDASTLLGISHQRVQQILNQRAS